MVNVFKLLAVPSVAISPADAELLGLLSHCRKGAL